MSREGSLGRRIGEKPRKRGFMRTYRVTLSLASKSEGIIQEEELGGGGL